MNSKVAVGRKRSLSRLDELRSMLSDEQDKLENPLISQEDKVLINELCGLIRRRLNAERSRIQKERSNEKTN